MSTYMGAKSMGSSSHVLYDRILFTLNHDPLWVSQLMGQVCGDSGK